jgi:SOS-response transcriptional repressor LexA
VRPKEPPRKQDWETSLSRARDAFNGGSSKAAAFTLFQALADAFRMAEYCHDELAKRGPKPLPPEKFNDWQDFLLTLYDDALKTYSKRSYLVKSVMAEPQTTFEKLTEAARIALLELQDMNEGKPSKRARGAALTSLGRLVIELDAAKDSLGQQPIYEDEERPTGTLSQEAANVPLVGRIAAGAPILAEEFIEDILPLPTQLVGQGTLFILKVVGDSMADAAITDGDWVVVRQQPGAENGEIVAALLDGEVTVKTLKWSDDNHVWLIPHNPNYKPILGDRATILGKVVTVLRRIR